MDRLFLIYGTRIFFVISLCLSFFPATNNAAVEDRLQAALIIKLPPDENAIIVEKQTQTLFVYAENSEGLVIKFKAPCSTGEIGGVKQEAGDKKTPEGLYFLKDEYEDKYLSPIYGQKAFPTDYPNLIDRRAGKNGSAIWIHGTNKKLVPMDSNGCVALENENIVKLSDYITLDSTPVIMVEKIEMEEGSAIVKQEQEITDMLTLWSRAFENSSYHEYLSFYAPEYLPDITWWEKWLAVRDQAAETGGHISFERSRTGIYQHDGIIAVLFRWSLKNGDKTADIGKRKLFLKKTNKGYKIIGDVFQRVPDQFAGKKDVLVAAAESISTPFCQEASVIEIVNRWMKAWSDKNMEAYASFYASDFFSDGMDKKRWVGRKKALAQKYGFIRVNGKDFEVKKEKETCEVVFFQDYESSGLSTQGTKRLKLVNKGGLWKIYRESWKKK